MSLRALKRLERLKQESQSPVQEEESSDEDYFIEPKKSNANAFALLSNEESDISDNNDEDNDNDNDNGKEEEYSAPIEPIRLASKKSKKKKKSKKTKQEYEFKETDNDNNNDIDDEELDRYLAKLRQNDRKQLGANGNNSDNQEINTIPLDEYYAGGKAFTIPKFKASIPLLQCQPKNLDPDKEFESMFGKLSSAVLEDADSTSSTFVTPDVLKQIKQMSKRVRGWAGKDRRSAPGISRKLTLTKIRDDWIPMSQKPLLMEELFGSDLQKLFESKSDDWIDVIKEDISKEISAGIKYFKVTEGSRTKVVNTQFYISVVINPDHESLLQLLRASPYHLETILQVSSILQRQGDNSNSNGLVERALFLFDWSLKQNFQLGSGLCRLPFEFFLNRQIYLTLFRYIIVLTQKNTFFTAFNYCKLLLSFDPTDDPYGVRYFIDFYACMANEYEYLIDFVNSPLVTTYKEWFTPSLAYSVVLAYLKIGNKQKAKEALEVAYREHPYAGYQILEKLGYCPLSWKDKKVPPVLPLSAAIYTVRVEALWDNPEERNFLKEELTKLIEKESVPFSDNIPINLLRYVILSNETSAMAKIPQSFWKSHEIFEFDILPPSNGDTIHSYINENSVGDAMIANSVEMDEEAQLAQIINNLNMQDANQ